MSTRPLEDAYSGKRALVTGGLGFIGSNLALRLVRLGCEVTVLDNELADCGANPFNLDPISAQVRITRGDIADRAVARPLLLEKDFIFNLAGNVSHTDSMRDPLKDLHANCLAHVHFLETCREAAPEARILYAGTRGEYGSPAQLPVDESTVLNPIDVNGINKISGEAYHLMYARHYGLRATSLRLSNTYGPRHQMKHHRQGVLNWFVRRTIDGDPIFIYGDGTQVRDTHYVDDVAEAMLLALASEKTAGQVYNLGGYPLSLRAVAELLVRLNGSGKTELKPYPADAKAVEIGSYVADYSKINRELGWSPATAPETGFRKTLEFYREYRSKYW
jgi:UDP-glucose 4-epimerase